VTDQRDRLAAVRDALRPVTVCAECLTAACWHGVFMCAKAKGADTTTRTVRELNELALEHPSNYSAKAVRRVHGGP
jgi:hypothetical protein